MSTNFMIRSLVPILRYPFTNSLIDSCCRTQLCYAISQSSQHRPLQCSHNPSYSLLHPHQCLVLLRWSDPPKSSQPPGQVGVANQRVGLTRTLASEIPSPDFGFHWCNRRRSYYLTTQDFCHAGPLPVDPIKIYSCNVTSHFQCSINLVQLDLQGYNPRNGQGLPKVGYKGPSNYSNSSTVGFEPRTSCMAVWQPNHYTKIARP